MRIGTRASRLALIQTEIVRKKLESIGTDCSVVNVSSHGDNNRKMPIYSMGKVGVFVDNLNRKIIDGEIDCAVHSAKDIPSHIDPALEISAVMERETVTDALLSNTDFAGLPENSVIGTSSLRRIKAIESIRDDLILRDIRGNIDTRLSRLKSGEYDGIVVATAALKRLGIKSGYHEFSAMNIVPAANQGIIAVVSRKGSRESDIISSISDHGTMQQMKLERGVVEGLSLGCSEPVGVLASQSDNGFKLYVRFYSKNDRDFMDFSYETGNGKGMERLIDEIRKSVPERYGYGL